MRLGQCRGTLVKNGAQVFAAQLMMDDTLCIVVLERCISPADVKYGVIGCMLRVMCVSVYRSTH